MISAGGGLVRFAATLRQILRQLAVMVPIAVIELNEAHTSLGKAAREHAVGGESSRLLRVRAIHIEDCLRLFG